MLPNQISESVEALRPELVAFIQKLVQTPSLSEQEHAVQAVLAEKMRALNLQVEVVPTVFDELRHHPAFNDDGFEANRRVNVVGRWGSSVAGLILNGHVDVVSPGDEALWSVPPWSGLVQAGKIYGRGACDMKSGVATGIFAIAALRRLGFEPARSVLMQTVIGEESGGVGTLTTIVKGYTAEACIVLEPTRLELSPVQSGALTFRLTVPGKAAHAALRQFGVSAIEKFAVVLNAILRLEAERHAQFAANPLAQLYPDMRYIAPISLGNVKGGEWHSTVAEKVVAEGRLGVFPGESTEAARQALVSAVARAAAADEWLSQHPPQVEWFEGQFEAGATDPQNPLIQTLAAAHETMLGHQPNITGVPYGADLRLFTNHARIPTVLYGAGDVSLAHAVDEHIEIEDVVQATKVIALMVANWCNRN
jgi:acetylornithine deacetylase